jgi:hypothetical protein
LDLQSPKTAFPNRSDEKRGRVRSSEQNGAAIAGDRRRFKIAENDDHASFRHRIGESIASDLPEKAGGGPRDR